MQVVILAGGLGTRLSEETQSIPKPMVEIGGYPILWHIMKQYSHYGFNEFIICCGYKGYMIKDYFAHYSQHNSDMTIDLQNNEITYHNTPKEEWKITLVDTGLNSLTANRILKVKPYLNKNKPFMMTYGDGVSDIDIKALVKFHKEHKKLATVSAVQLKGKFGALTVDGKAVTSFKEKPSDENSFMNAGFFVLDYNVFDYIEKECLQEFADYTLPNYIEEEQVMFEHSPLENITSANQLMAYKHDGFWHCMDTLRNKLDLNDMWNNNKAKWKVW